MSLVSASGRQLDYVPGRSVVHFKDGAIQDDVYTADCTYEAEQWAAFKNRSTPANRIFVVMPEEPV